MVVETTLSSRVVICPTLVLVLIRKYLNATSILNEMCTVAAYYSHCIQQVQLSLTQNYIYFVWSFYLVLVILEYQTSRINWILIQMNIYMTMNSAFLSF